jgi:hypothetical protein
MIEKFQSLEVGGRKSSKPWKFFAVLFPMLGSLAFAQGPGSLTGFFQAWWGVKSGFNPAFINGLTLWLDANDRQTLWSDGGATVSVTNNGLIARWNDKSGQNYNATQATTNNMPVFISGATPSVRFAGSSTQSLTNNLASIYSAGQSNYTAFLISKSDNFSGNQFAFLLGNDANRMTAFQFFTGSPANGLYGYAGESSAAIAIGLPSANEIVLVSWEYDGSEGQNTNRLAGRYYGSLSSPVFQQGTIGQTIASATAGYFVGNRSSLAGRFAGNIYEIIIFNRKITNFERQKVEGYAAHKWGFVAQLENDHPYKNAPP